MKTKLKRRDAETQSLKIKVVRDDSIPAFGAWHSCKDKKCPNNNVILLNLEAHFGDMVYADGSPVRKLSAKRSFDILIETLMHEFGHALEQFFKSEFSEQRMEKITASFRAKKSLRLRASALKETPSSTPK